MWLCKICFGFLEIGRLVLEQLELWVNSHVCSNEAELHLKREKNSFIHVCLLNAGSGVRGITD